MRQEARAISILGSTGSIGRSTLDVVRAERGRFRVAALAAHRRVDELAAQAAEFRPDLVVCAPEFVPPLREALAGRGVRVRVEAGAAGLSAAAAHPDATTVVAAIVGAAGLVPVIEAIRAGKRLCLANKEALVVGGPLVTGLARERGVEIIPVDSEHSALWQMLRGQPPRAVRRLILTASGGPLRTRDAATLDSVTVEEALAHPSWSMGAKISVDSATLMNKGLEVIEAVRLFDLPPDRIDVVVHPRSIVHSLVEFVDGAIFAHLGPTDMRLPIHYALHHPDRATQNLLPPLDLATIGSLSFEPPRLADFPCLNLARRAITSGGTMPCVMNAANEAAVAAFLAREIRFTAIPEAIEAAMDAHRVEPSPTLPRLLDLDGEIRKNVAASLTGKGTARA